MRRLVTIGFAVAIAAGSLQLHAQNQAPLAHIRELYSNAAYEDVLSAVAADTTTSPQIGQYKVFSLIALGRADDAEQAAEAVLVTSPGFHPDSDASPRLIDVFTNARRKVTPDVLKSMYTKARGLLETKDREGAIKAFADVVALASDPDLKDDKTVSELGLLASGFLDLSRALPAAPQPPAPSDVPAVKQDATASTSAPAKPLPPAVVVQSQPVHEDLPPWAPPGGLAHAQFKGKILVHIGADGSVESAEIVESIHPLYDQLLLTATRKWVYTPARSNGVAVPSERVVSVVLKPSAEVPQ
jgi:hypothetical protein